ncbi:hypothetical protein [Bacillus thuringiensis]|uniref:hypothetical protein n=1 Tax=Bacillus thuringiensis TaxID=1428 RepID=UPI00211B27CD|nr:hypothetical protein [Bacillus thuringiensis]
MGILKLFYQMGMNILYLSSLNTLLEREIVNKEGEIHNKFIHIQQVDLETGNKMNITLNPQHIATTEELSLAKHQNIPSVFRVEKNLGLETK